MNKLGLKRIHLENLHTRKCLWDNIMGNNIMGQHYLLWETSRTEGISAGPLYCCMGTGNKQEKQEIPVQIHDCDHCRCLLQAA